MRILETFLLFLFLLNIRQFVEEFDRLIFLEIFFVKAGESFRVIAWKLIDEFPAHILDWRLYRLEILEFFQEFIYKLAVNSRFSELAPE